MSDPPVPAAIEAVFRRESGRLISVLVRRGRRPRLVAAADRWRRSAVKLHVAAICAILGATNRTDAARRALRRGLITL